MGGLNMNLRPYQIEDARELMKHNSYGVFNEQRTGKTPTSLTAMTAMARGRILIVCTASMLYKWAEEAKTWTDRDVYVYAGSKTHRAVALSYFEANPKSIMVVSYDLFKTTKNSEGLKDLIVNKIKPEGLIVDEAHRCVNRGTANFKSLRRLVKIPYRLYLTGTPAPNHPSQVWALLTMIDPKRFTSYWRFVEEFFAIDVQRVSNNASIDSVQKPTDFLPTKEQEFIQLLNKYSIMRKRADVMPWLPPQEPPTRIKLPLTPSQRKYLHELSNFFETDHVIVQGVLDQLLRYRQICLAPELLGLKGNSPKLDWLETYISEYSEKSIVVFSRFTKFLHLAKEKLKCDAGVIVGEVSAKERQDLINDFQSDNIKVLLIQIDAGKEGLTLDQADTLIFTDTYPPASDILQARDRIVATTESRNKPKEIIELAMAESYDEALYELVDHRIDSTDIANNYIKYVKGVEV